MSPRAEQTRPVMRATRDTLRQILKGLPGALVVINDAAIIIYASEGIQTMTGMAPEAVCGKSLWSCVPQLVSTTLHQAVHVTRQSEEPTRVEYISPVTRLRVHASLSPTDQGLTIFFQYPLEPRQAKDELRALVDAIPQVVWVMYPDGTCDYCNHRWYDYTGQHPEQAQGDGWLQCIHPDDRQRILSVWQRAAQSGEVYEVEQRVRQNATGVYRWFLARALPMRDESGQVVKWLGTCTDIENQKQTEQQLKENWESWRVLAEAVPQLVWTAFSDGQFEYANQRCCEYTGVTLEELQRNRWAHLQFIHPDDREGNRIRWQHALATGEMYEHEERLKNGLTGVYRWFLVRALPVRNEAGRITKWFGTCTDIENQKRTEQALRQSQERIRALVDSNMIGIVFLEGEEEVLVEANEAFFHMTGYSQMDVLNRTLTREKITPPEQAALFAWASEESATHGQHTPFEADIVCRDGNHLPVLVGSVPLQGYPRQVISFVLDNSARKELEQRKDDFISMAGHELRNPLTALKVQAQLIRKRLHKQGLADVAAAFARMERPIKQLERLIAELLDVSKIQAGRLEYIQELVDVDALLQEIVDTMQQAHSSHRIRVNGRTKSRLKGDRDRLGQVFTNLLSNAMKYSPNAQTIEVNLQATPETVSIQVRDHGLGIPREQCDKIFERFYRATSPQQAAISGLGMGLYIVAEIVKRHGGTITVESEVAKGSTFTVTFPRETEEL